MGTGVLQETLAHAIWWGTVNGMRQRRQKATLWHAAQQQFRARVTVPCRALAAIACAVLLLCTAAQTAAAQLVAAQTDAAAPLTPEQRRLLLEPSSDGESYRLGPGDLITITVPGRPELTGKQTVGPDGAVTLPLIGSVDVTGKTREQSAALLREKLLLYYTDPAVTVSVDTYTSNRVILVGAVEHPGPYIFERQPTLLDLLARGGSLGRTQNAVGSNFAGVTGSANRALPDHAIIYRGTETAISIDLAAMAKQGNMLANIRLQRDDVVYIPSLDDRYISVLGQVQHPGAQPLEHETTLARLLSNAGGLTREAGANPTVRIVEPSSGKTRLVAFNDLLNPTSTEIPLHSGDIVFIPQSRFNSFAYVLDRLSPAFNLFTTAALFNQR